MPLPLPVPALTQAETGVTYNRQQWDAIEWIREYLKEAESEDPEAKDPDPNMTNGLMCLCILVVKQDTSRIALYESPLMHYLAVRGIDEQSQALRAAFFYTPILAGALWISRLIMLEVAVAVEEWPTLGLKSRAQIESVRDSIHELRRDFMCEGSFSPMASILSQLAMGKHFAKLHKSPANIHWARDEQTIFYQGKGVAMAKIRTMCHTLIQELQEAMQELAFGSSVPSIDLDSIVDSMAWSQAFRRQNYSFIEHVQNRDRTGVGYRYLLERAQRGEGGWRLMRKSRGSGSGSGSGQMEWADGQVRKYLNKERQFLRKLMVCMHITGRRPSI